MSKPSKQSPAKTDSLSFEQRLNKLEELIQELESGDLELADSLDRFKQGVELSQQCREMLDQAQQTIETLSKPEDENSTQPFDLTNPGSER